MDAQSLQVGGIAPRATVEAILGLLGESRADRGSTPGWSTFEGLLPFARISELVTQLAAAPAGLAVLGPSGDAGVILLAKSGQVSEVPFGVALRDSMTREQVTTSVAALVAWSAEFGGRALSALAVQRLIRDLDITDGFGAVELVLHRLRLSPPTQPKRKTLPYGDMTELVDPNGRPQYVGDERLDWNTQRWLPGFGEDREGRFIGLWDRDAPAAPIRRFGDGSDQFHECLGIANELVMRPILERTVLAGDRLWASLDEKWGAPAIILHWAPDHHLGLHTTGRPSRTAERTPGAAAELNQSVAKKFGHPVSNRNVIHPLDTLNDAILAANYRLVDLNPGWQPIPDDVPRGLLATVDWVNAQCDADPPWRWAYAM